MNSMLSDRVASLGSLELDKEIARTRGGCGEENKDRPVFDLPGSCSNDGRMGKNTLEEGSNMFT
jgi:hypothetical protein